MQISNLKWILFLFLTLSLTSCVDGLNVSDDKEFKLVQRGTKLISGSDGDVELILNDITGGSTEVKIVNIDSEQLYFKKYMSAGESAVFQYGHHYYRIKINALENHLLHEDYAYIAMRKVPAELGQAKVEPVPNVTETPITPEEIRAYLDKIKESNLSFVRNGDIIPDSTMSIHLENKYMMNKRDIKTKEDFKLKVITSSSLTGEKYQVMASEGKIMSLEDWLEI